MDGVERGLRFIGAVLLASFAAGPVFCLILFLFDLPSNLAGIGEGLFAVLVIAIPYGAILAFLPNLIGTAVMTLLGSWLTAARSWLAWVIAGALGGMLMTMFWYALAPADRQLTAAMILTGAACAAVCRSLTRWPEPDGDAQA